jgi:membrane protease YdiL (CAAX protease family)
VTQPPPPPIQPTQPTQLPTPPSVPAGWYPDPWQPAGWRWWDGMAWTGHVASGQASLPDAEPDPRRPGWAGIVDPPEGRWGLWDVAITVATTVAAVVAFLVLVGVLVAITDTSSSSLAEDTPLGAWLVVASLIAQWVGMIGWPIVVAHRKGPGWRSAYGFRPRWSSLGWGVLGGFGTLMAVLVGVAVVVAVTGAEVSSTAGDVATGMRGTGPPFVIFAVMLAFGAPFVEELLFRGLIFGALVKRFGRPWLAIIITAIAFGAFHFEPLRLLGLAMGGVVLGIVRYKAGLAASMVSHATLNSLAALGLLLGSGMAFLR